MPLRDHFHPPISKRHSWDEVHGLWPGAIVFDLFRKLPPRYVAAPNIHLGALAQIDVVGFDKASEELSSNGFLDEGGGVATATWSPPKATLDVGAELFGQDEYEVRVYDLEMDRRLVAAIEIVSPSNKDRPSSREEFVAKCASLLRARVSVAIVDLVTERRVNLYAELLESIEQTDESMGSPPPTTYATVCRWTGAKKKGRLQTWSNSLNVGEKLPTLPLWLAENLAVPLELESTYEETCKTLRIP